MVASTAFSFASISIDIRRNKYFTKTTSSACENMQAQANKHLLKFCEHFKQKANFASSTTKF